MALFSWLKRRRLDEDDFRDEIRSHLAMATDEHVANGADRQSAHLRSLKDFGNVTPAQWTQMAKELDGPDVDGVFLSCTNTTQIEAIADIERDLGKPVVNSNQAVLWGCVKRLKKTLPPLKPMPALGRLMRHLD